jgi:hypothetical protein
MLYERVSDEQLKNEPEGVFDDCSKHVNDQDMLCLVLYHKYRQAAKIYRGDEHNAFNYDGPFIKQVLRGNRGVALEDRVQEIKNLVNDVNSRFPKPSQQPMTPRRIL